jgi:hypothetical protein
MLTALLTTISFATTLGSPPGTPPTFADRLEHAEFIGSDSDAQIVAYDHAGEVMGTIALWVEPNGQIYLASDYGDGYAETVVIDGRARTDSTLPAEVITARADAVLNAIEVSGPQEGWFTCSLVVVAGAGACVAASIIGCPVGIYSAGCACLPLAMKDFKCPNA